jgi:hypothetical protein
MHASIDVQRSLLNSVADRTNMVKTFVKGTLSSEEWAWNNAMPSRIRHVQDGLNGGNIPIADTLFSSW